MRESCKRYYSQYWLAIGESALAVNPDTSERSFQVQVNAKTGHPKQHLEVGVTDCDPASLDLEKAHKKQRVVRSWSVCFGNGKGYVCTSWNQDIKPIALALAQSTLQNGDCITITITKAMELHMEQNGEPVLASLPIGASPTVDLWPLIEFHRVGICARFLAHGSEMKTWEGDDDHYRQGCDGRQRYDDRQQQRYEDRHRQGYADGQRYDDRQRQGYDDRHLQGYDKRQRQDDEQRYDGIQSQGRSSPLKHKYDEVPKSQCPDKACLADLQPESK